MINVVWCFLLLEERQWSVNEERTFLEEKKKIGQELRFDGFSNNLTEGPQSLIEGWGMVLEDNANHLYLSNSCAELFMSDKTEALLCLLNFGFQVSQEDWFICSFFISLSSKELLRYLPGTRSRTNAYSDGPICFVCHVCSQKSSWSSGDGLSHSQGSLYTVLCYMAVYLVQKTCMKLVPTEVCTAEFRWDGLGTWFSGQGWSLWVC